MEGTLLPLHVRNAVLIGAGAMAIVGGVMEAVNCSKVKVDQTCNLSS